MIDDPTQGWEAVAALLMERREHSHIGVGVVTAWAKTLCSAAAVLDLGCGAGIPVSKTLIDAGCSVTGIDSSPTLVAAFRSRFPGSDAVCERAETSTFLGRTYDAAVAVGLVFLLSAAAQQALIANVGAALRTGGRFLFTSPRQACVWNDLMTGRESRSLGAGAYRALLSEAGLTLTGEYTDEGQNHYYDATRR